MANPAFEPWEARMRAEGAPVVAGVDEVGRGCLAGPVVAAAVIFPVDVVVSGVRDSKQMTKAARERVFGRIIEASVAFGLAMVDASTIDAINILQASLLAMSRAISRLRVQPDCVLVDGNCAIPGLSIRQALVVDGDARVHAIAAASIIAKVARDRLMQSYDRDFPLYGFGAHKGYGTLAHRNALKAHGVTDLHRRSFAPVRAVLQAN